MRIFSAIKGIVFLIVFTSAAPACSVPVFRYALDRWKADRFRLEVPASAPSPQRLMDSFGAGAEVNLSIVRDNPSATIPDARLFFPNGDASVWRGSPDTKALVSLTTSPARAELARRIVAGDSAVWVVLEKAPDDGTVVRLEKRLRFLEQSIALPPISPDDPTSKLGPGPKVAVKFSVLRLRRDDSAEAQFMPILLGPKRDTLPADATLLIPIFGRGRALGAWPAEKMDDEQITEASRFLCGACSCEVKSLNPGWDLLINFDWDAALAAYTPDGEGSVLVTGVDRKIQDLDVPIAPAPAMVPRPGGGSAAAPPAAPLARLGTAIIVAAALALISGIFLIAVRK